MRWTIEPDGPDLMLTKGRRVCLWSATEDEIKRYLKRYLSTGDTVRRVHPDGRVEETRDASPGRRHWRGPKS